MVGLLSLSNELLVKVFASSDTIQSAATLSRVDKTMHSLWVEHNNHILENILPTQTIGYEDATDLAILEEIWIKKNTELATKTPTRPRVRSYLSNLLHNAKLATSATAALKASRENALPYLYNKLHPDVTSYHIAYYRMRKTVLGRLRPEAHLKHVMYSTIIVSPGDDNNIIGEFNNFLALDELRHRTAYRTYQQTCIEQRKTDAEKEEPQRHGFALLHGFVLAGHHQYVSHALHVWRHDIFMINLEKIQKRTLAIRATTEKIQKATIAMKANTEKFQKSVLAKETNREELQKNLLAIKTNGEKLQKDVLAMKTVLEEYLHGVGSSRGL